MQWLDAKEAGCRWVDEVASGISGFQGSTFHGSITWAEPDTLLDRWSDVGILVVADPGSASVASSKQLHDGVLLDIALLSPDEVRTPEQILSRYDLAGSFRTSSIIRDPSGQLTELQQGVERDFVNREWIEWRCADAMNRVRRHLTNAALATACHDQVTYSVFAAGVTTHVLLTAGLRNPTIRRRFAAVRELLEERDMLDIHDQLLAMWGYDSLSREQIEGHFAALTEVFDVASTIDRPDLYFNSDISDIARPVAIDGTRALIDQGLHREAVFWIVETWSRCLQMPPIGSRQHEWEHGFQTLLSDLGIDSTGDLQERNREIMGALPWIDGVSRQIIGAPGGP